MRPKLIALMMGLAGIGVLGWTMHRSITESLQPFDARVVTEGWASVLIVLGFGLLLGSLAVLLQPHNQTNSLNRLLFGTIWGTLGASIGGFFSESLIVPAGCLGAEVGLLGGVLFNRIAPSEPPLFGLLYGIGAGTLVVFGLLISKPDQFAVVFANRHSLLEAWVVSVTLGALPGSIWGAVGDEIWYAQSS